MYKISKEWYPPAPLQDDREIPEGVNGNWGELGDARQAIAHKTTLNNTNEWIK